MAPERRAAAGRPPKVRRGEVWFADIPGDKRRPVLVLTRDPMGAVLQSVVCAPVTSRIRSIGTEVPLGSANGLAHDSVANCDNTMLVPRAKLIRRLGTADAETMRAACDAVRLALGCP